jgi:hypothetical protein
MEVVGAESVEDFRFDERQLLSVLLARREVPEDDADRVALLLERALARGMGRIEQLVARAQVAERWSDFKDPGYTPERAEFRDPSFEVET